MRLRQIAFVARAAPGELAPGVRGVEVGRSGLAGERAHAPNSGNRRRRDPGRGADTLWAARWGELFTRPVVRDTAGRAAILFDNMTLRFVADKDGRGTGIGALDILPQDRTAILDAAEARGRRTADAQVTLCGVRFNLL